MGLVGEVFGEIKKIWTTRSFENNRRKLEGLRKRYDGDIGKVIDNVIKLNASVEKIAENSSLRRSINEVSDAIVEIHRTSEEIINKYERFNLKTYYGKNKFPIFHLTIIKADTDPDLARRDRGKKTRGVTPSLIISHYDNFINKFLRLH
jgi:hypothetical protein